MFEGCPHILSLSLSLSLSVFVLYPRLSERIIFLLLIQSLHLNDFAQTKLHLKALPGESNIIINNNNSSHNENSNNNENNIQSEF